MDHATLVRFRNEILAFYHLEVDHGFVDAGGIRTFYLLAGSGPPLVMLHGAGGGGVLWAPVIDRLRRHFRLILPDVVGYGESDKPDGPYNRCYYAGWLRGFMDAMGLERAGLVGNSQGGAIAAQFAIDNPARVTQLVLVCSAGLHPLRSLGWKAIADMIRVQFLVSQRSMRRLVRHLVFDPSRFPLDSAVRYLQAVVGLPGGKRPFLNGRGRAVRPFKAGDLDRIQCPTLILWGAEDRIIRTAATSIHRAAIAGATALTIPGAGHTPFVDRPDLFARHLTEFYFGRAKTPVP